MATHPDGSNYRRIPRREFVPARPGKTSANNMSLSRQLFDAAERSVDELKELLAGTHGSLRVRNGAGQTLAHMAAKSNNLDVVRFILEKEPSLLHQRDGYNCSLLHVATVKGSYDVVKFLVEEQKVDACHLGGRFHDRTALHAAAEFNHMKILKYFVEERNIDCNMPNKEQAQPPLFLAVKRRNWDVIKYLVEDRKANVQILNLNDENILFIIVRENAMSIMTYLLDDKRFYFNVDCRSYYGETLVHVAAILDRREMLTYLVEEKGADVNIRKRYDKRTPLHYAALRNHFEVCRFLVEHGADANAVDAAGQIPADKAKDHSLIEYLENAARTRVPRSVISPYCPPWRLEPLSTMTLPSYQRKSIEDAASSSLRYSPNESLRGPLVNVSHFQNVLFLAKLISKKIAGSERPISFPSPSSFLRSRISFMPVDVVDEEMDFLQI